MTSIDQVLIDVEPSILPVEGDTNTVMAVTIAANKRVVSISHVEAGLRNFDLRMPEEHNRRFMDHTSK